MCRESTRAWCICNIPDGTSWEGAATIPLAGNTAYLALFSEDSLKMSHDKRTKQTLLIWGGSSTVGKFAIQLAKYYDIEVIATCSPHNFDTVRRAGARQVFDYNDSNVISKIQAAAPGLSYAFDTIGSASSSPAAAGGMGKNKGHLCTVRPGKVHTEDVPGNIEISDVFVFSAFLKEHTYNKKAYWPPLPEHHSVSAEFYDLVPNLLASSELTPHRVKDMGKLSPDSLKEAIKLNKEGRISNEKLCFQVTIN